MENNEIKIDDFKNSKFSLEEKNNAIFHAMQSGQISFSEFLKLKKDIDIEKIKRDGKYWGEE